MRENNIKRIHFILGLVSIIQFSSSHRPLILLPELLYLLMAVFLLSAVFDLY